MRSFEEKIDLFAEISACVIVWLLATAITFGAGYVIVSFVTWNLSVNNPTMLRGYLLFVAVFWMFFIINNAKEICEEKNKDKVGGRRGN